MFLYYCYWSCDIRGVVDFPFVLTWLILNDDRLSGLKQMLIEKIVKESQ